MVKQITIDDKRVITACSIGGRLYGGIGVDNIPPEVMAEPSKYKYIDGEYTDNPDYKPEEPPVDIGTEELALAVADLAETAASDKLELQMAIADLAEVILNG